jgi:glycosyltransferase involved in cell wall biosynthesis
VDLLTQDSQVPEVSIIVPARDEAEVSGQFDIVACLHAISGITTSTIGNGKVQVVVVDNGSKDQTGYWARLCGAEVIVEETPGIQAARQRGLRTARAPIIFQTDADTLVSPNWVDALYPSFQDPEVVGLCGEGIFYGVRPDTYLYKIFIAQMKRLIVPGQISMVAGFNMAYRRQEALATIETSPKVGKGEDEVMVLELQRRGKVIPCQVFGAEAYTSPRRIHEETLRKRMKSIFHVAQRTIGHLLARDPMGIFVRTKEALEETPWQQKKK